MGSEGEVQGNKARTNTIPHEPPIFIADKFVEVDMSVNPVAFFVLGAGAKNVAIFKPDVF